MVAFFTLSRAQERSVLENQDPRGFAAVNSGEISLQPGKLWRPCILGFLAINIGIVNRPEVVRVPKGTVAVTRNSAITSDVCGIVDIILSR